MTCQDSLPRGCAGIDVQVVRIAGDRRQYRLCRDCRAHYAAVWHFDFLPVDAPEPWKPRWIGARAKDRTGELVA